MMRKGLPCVVTERGALCELCRLDGPLTAFFGTTWWWMGKCTEATVHTVHNHAVVANMRESSAVAIWVN